PIYLDPVGGPAIDRPGNERRHRGGVGQRSSVPPGEVTVMAAQRLTDGIVEDGVTGVRHHTGSSSGPLPSVIAIYPFRLSPTCTEWSGPRDTVRVSIGLRSRPPAGLSSPTVTEQRYSSSSGPITRQSSTCICPNASPLAGSVHIGPFSHSLRSSRLNESGTR